MAMLDLAGILHNTPSGTKAKPSQIRLHGGTYAGECLLARKKWINIEPFGDGPVIIQGGVHYCLKLDHCDSVWLRGITFTKSRNWGLMAASCNNLIWEDLVSDFNDDNGYLTTKVSGILVKNCKGRKSVTGHGLYFSEAGSDYTVEGGEYTHNARCGIQVNAHPGGAKDLRINDADCRWNGNASIQCAGVTGATLAGNKTLGSRQGIVLWDDMGGQKYGCHDFDLLRQAGPFSICPPPVCTNIRMVKGAWVVQ